MPSGPVLIFDKSTLQGLNADEAVWLDNFFSCNITPLFYIETLADLEKKVVGGRTPEQVVGDIATKTPDMHSHPNAFHLQLLEAELRGADTIAMDGRGILTGGKPVTFRGNKGIRLPESKEQEAFHRWQLRDFLGVERHVARAWRSSLSVSDARQWYEFFRHVFLRGRSLRDFREVRERVDEYIEHSDQERVFRVGMTLFAIPPDAQAQIVQNWRAMSEAKFSQVFPYFAFLYSVELFFFVALASDLISRERPTNKVDFAYLYYLPFCKVFTSGDKLHERAAPFFMRADQAFVKAIELKTELGKLDAHYSTLPEETKRGGLYRFAGWPPDDDSFLVTRLWDRYIPNWRQSKEHEGKVTPEIIETLRKLAENIRDGSQPCNQVRGFTIEESDYVQMEGKVLRKKGKWNRFGPEVK